MILTNAAKRLCIYFIYDKDGIIDDYIIYQLKDMKKNVSFIHCVINGALTEESRKKLEAVADEVFERENTGFDVGAYKAAIEHIGWNKLMKYDELVLMNYTCFGPIYPFKEAFDWAKKQDLDFWGLTMGICEMHNFPQEYSKYPFAREHIQSYFLVIRKSLLNNKLFKEFMDSRPEVKTYSDSGLYFENVFTNYFRTNGFSFSTYCDCTELLKLHNYPMMIFPLQLIRKYRCPLFKRKLFTEAYTSLLSQCAGQSPQDVLTFLEHNKVYDMDLIWQSLLRTENLSVLVRNCHLKRILPRDYELPASKNALSVCVVFHVYYMDLIDDTIKSLINFPKNTDFYITTNSKEKKEVINKRLSKLGYKYEIRVIENKGRDMSALVVGAADVVGKYDLVCFSHDKKTSQQKPGSVGAAWANELSENMFATKEYVKNVIGLFEKEPNLGIAFPPYPTHNEYSGLATGWVMNYELTRKLLDEYNVKVKTDPRTLCVAPLGTNFWFRSKALQKMFEIDWKYSDFPQEPNRNDGTILHAIERSFAYFAQDVGYYPVYILNDVYSRIELTNLEIEKVGSLQMYRWIECEAMAIINNNIQAENNVVYTAGNQEEAALIAANSGIGIKGSLKLLSNAVHNRFPLIWKLAMPFRWLLKKILKINTK